MQKSVAFEKANVLFNIAAVHSQMGAKEDRKTPDGLARAVESFSKAAGVINYIKDNFSHPPLTDLRPETLVFLGQVFLVSGRRRVGTTEEREIVDWRNGGVKFGLFLRPKSKSASTAGRL
jgi:BRO1-like domain